MDRIKTGFDKIVNYAKQRSYKNKKNGEALRSHLLAKHSGILDDDCPACNTLLTNLKESDSITYMQWFRLLPGVPYKRVAWVCNSCKFNYHNCGSPKCGCAPCASKRGKRRFDGKLGVWFL